MVASAMIFAFPRLITTQRRRLAILVSKARLAVFVAFGLVLPSALVFYFAGFERTLR